MVSTWPKEGGDDLVGVRIDGDLGLLGMSLFLPRIKLFLTISSRANPLFMKLSLFFGRSTGLSVASKMATSNSWSETVSTFFPGNRNRVDCIKIVSVFRMIRPTVVSFTPSSREAHGFLD